MKHRIILISLVLSSVMSINAYSQTRIIIETDEKESKVFSVDGQKITIEDKTNDKKIEKSFKRTPKQIDMEWLNRFRWGFNYMIDNEYFDLNRVKSAHFSMDFFTINAYLNRNKTVSIATGLQYSYNDMVFRKNESIVANNNLVSLYNLTRGVRKSKLAGHYLGIPLYLEFQSNNVKLSFMGFANYNFAAITRQRDKHYSNRDTFSGLNVFQYGVGLGITYSGIGLFVQYTHSPFFKKDAKLDGTKSLNDIRCLSAGLHLNF